MKRAKCIYCDWVGSVFILTDNIQCPKCFRHNPLGRQQTLEKKRQMTKKGKGKWENPIVKRKRESFKPVKWGELFTEKEAETIWQSILMRGIHPKAEDKLERKLERLSQGWFR